MKVFTFLPVALVALVVPLGIVASASAQQNRVEARTVIENRQVDSGQRQSDRPHQAENEDNHCRITGLTFEKAANGNGLKVTEISPGSPAADADIVVGDIVVSIDGSTIDSTQDLRRAMRQNQNRDSQNDILVEIKRDDQTQRVSMKLDAKNKMQNRRTSNTTGDQPRQHQSDKRRENNIHRNSNPMVDYDQTNRRSVIQSGDQATLGVSMAINDHDQGVRVVDVLHNSPAARAGITSGDRILNVNGNSVETSSDVARQIQGMKPNQTVQLTLDSNGRRENIAVRLGSRNETVQAQSVWTSKQRGRVDDERNWHQGQQHRQYDAAGPTPDYDMAPNQRDDSSRAMLRDIRDELRELRRRVNRLESRDIRYGSSGQLEDRYDGSSTYRSNRIDYDRTDYDRTDYDRNDDVRVDIDRDDYNQLDSNPANYNRYDNHRYDQNLDNPHYTDDRWDGRRGTNAYDDLEDDENSQRNLRDQIQDAVRRDGIVDESDERDNPRNR